MVGYREGQVEGDEDGEMEGGGLAVQNPKELIPPPFLALNSPNSVPNTILLC